MPALENLVRENRTLLAQRPSAFFSVCMSAAGPNAKPATALGYIDEFITRTGWQPGRIASFAGALPWSKYNPFIRLMMRIIVRMAGGDTDTSRDLRVHGLGSGRALRRGVRAAASGVAGGVAP
jgi:menaquinone-dependent protoporphyrinogen oxidase